VIAWSTISLATGLQVGSTVAAAAAAIASWFAIGQSRKLNQETRSPDLVVTASFINAGQRKPHMGVTIVNAGGGIARHVSFIIATSRQVARCPVASGILLPGEVANFGSDMDADSEHRAVVYARGPDGDFAWNLDGEKREIERRRTLPSSETIFKAFYPDIDLDDLQLTQMLRG
jgi:hypothetical protein